MKGIRMNNGYQKLLHFLEEGPVCVATVLAGQSAGQKLYWRDDQLLCGIPEQPELFDQIIKAVHDKKLTLPGRAAFSETEIFAERLVQEPELVICGGGHISLELAAMADYMNYSYTVLDDREEFCSRERFPGAKACICGPFDQALKEHTFSANAYYVIVTRGHRADQQCLELILQRPYGYVGMIGSRKKVGKTMELLTQKGYQEEVLRTIHAPIGLNIGGQTPKEIAVSIIAQLIQEKNKEVPSSYLEPELIQGLTENPSAVMATIISKEGSAPRGVGSRMLVGKDGRLCGTIGGGLVEYKATERAGKLSSPVMVENYQVNTDSAAALGMWCGGAVDVLFEQL